MITVTHCVKPPCASDPPAQFALLGNVKSPKSCALPVDAIVIKSIVFTLFPDPLAAVVPPENVPLTLLLLPVIFLLATVKLPKSVAFPSVAIVIKLIVSTTLGDLPPPKQPRTALLTLPWPDWSSVKSPNLSGDHPLAIKTNAMVNKLLLSSSPPANTALVPFERPATFLVGTELKVFPKDVFSPNDCKFI